MNTYAYVGGNPLIRRDISGLSCECDRKAGSVAPWYGISGGGSGGLVVYASAKTAVLANVFTSEICTVSIRCGGAGIYGGAFFGSVSAEFSVTGSWCGKDLSGFSVGLLGDAGVGCETIGGAAGGSPSGAESTLGWKGCGLGAGIAFYGCFARVLRCNSSDSFWEGVSWE